LLERFLDGVPSARHREALEVCAHARVTTEALLADAISGEEAPELFRWLRGLSFIEQGREGLFPHDLAREALDADLRWRNPEAYRDLHRRVRRSVVSRAQSTRGREQQRAAVDLMYLHRTNPLMRRLQIAHWESLGLGYAEAASEGDFPTLISIVRRHEGDQSARIARYWSERQPGGFTVLRTTAGEILGFTASVHLDDSAAGDASADPAAATALEFTRRHGRLRAGERALHHRFWMGRDTYQSVSPVLNVVASVAISYWLGTPDLAWSFVTFADPDAWRETFAYMRFRREPEADFEVGGRRYGVFAHDWRAEPPPLWLDLMGEREIASDLSLAEMAAPTRDGALSRTEFEAAVRRAFRDFTRPAALATNPLLRSRAAARHTAGAPSPAALQSLLSATVETLRSNPRDEKLYRALRSTYLEPAASQELAAEALGLPFSTYRHHLGRGLAQVTEALWRDECAP
jgi:hypothetical protein